MTVLYLLLFFVLGQLIVGSLHTLWFFTSLPVHLTKLLRKAGWRKHDDTLWPNAIDYQFWTRSQWVDWMQLQSPWSNWVKEGLNCSGCMAAQLSAWVALGLVLCGGFFDLWQLLLLGPLSWPWAVIVVHVVLKALFKYTKKPLFDDAYPPAP